MNKTGAAPMHAKSQFATALVMDSVQSDVELTIAMPRSVGFAVDQAANAQSGLALLRAKAYDTLLLDISMPGTNGIAVCRQIRAEKIPVGRVIAYTAHAFANEHERQAMMAAGFDTLLIRPVSYGSLKEAISPAPRAIAA